ncbi:MAG: bifunctional sugar-1-phosphate nucleotidylyltransferase/acetyltransferase [Candidatus Woesearchaeota archaeon]
MNKDITAIMLAAGASTRTWPLTITRPKPLLKVANKEIIMHNLEALDKIKEIKEAIIVVGFKKEMIIYFLKDKNFNFKISFVEQKEQLGTGDAVKSVFENKKIKGRLMIIGGDDLFSEKDIENCVKEEYSILAKEVDEIKNFGAIIKEGNYLKDFVEKPETEISRTANAGLYVVDDSIKDEILKLKKSSRGEFELVDAIKEFSKKKKIKVVEVKDYWIPITYPWSLLDANALLLDRIEEKIEGTIEEGARIKGKLILGKNSIIKSGVYIEGPVMIGENCIVGPNCYLRASTTIGNNCHIGQAVEIKNSIFFDNSKCNHLSYIGDSVIGYNVNLGAGTITANLRHDNASVKSMVKDQLIDTKRRKLGAIIADNVHTGIHTSIYPGRKIYPEKTTLPGEIVKFDVE